jgi:hypothetical protein
MGCEEERPRKQLKMSTLPSTPGSSCNPSTHPFSALASSPNGSTGISLDSALKTKTNGGPAHGIQAAKVSSASGSAIGGKGPKKLVLKTNRGELVTVIIVVEASTFVDRL